MTKIDNLKKVRRLIEIAEPDMIDMARLGRPSCGTPGCIAGWALVAAGDPYGSFHDARRFLNMGMEQSDNLFIGTMAERHIECLKITKDEVLTAVDSLIADPERVMPAWPDRVVEAMEMADE